MLYLTIAALVNDIQRSGTLIGATIPHPSQIRRCSWYNALITDEIGVNVASVLAKSVSTEPQAMSEPDSLIA